MNSVESGLHDLFRTQAAETPDGLAIVAGHEQTSYFQLDQATDSLGAYLRYHGVSSDDPVGIFMETCSEYIVASIGILKAGAAFMPMALDSPERLLSAIVTESRPKVVITKAQHVSRLSRFAGTHILVIDGDQSWKRFKAASRGPRPGERKFGVPPLHLWYDRRSKGSNADQRLRHFILLR